jgi:two-component system, chemotaxis family, CheB/CheR fusion protein
MTFFSECEAFEKIAKGHHTGIVQGPGRGRNIRMWISGCATGEEAYSFSILLLKAAARHPLRPAIQVFGSDLDSIFYAGQVETDRQLAEWANTASLPSRLASA